MNLDTILEYNGFTESERKQINDIVYIFIKSCDPEVDDFCGPTSDFKENLMKGLGRYE